ncbi:MAG: hypothetical protein ACKOEO_18515, partial [Planctomycetaceae bacterium]
MFVPAEVFCGWPFRAFDEFVEFATVQPDPSTLWAVVNLNPLAVGHPKFHFAQGTQHGALLEMDESANVLVIRSERDFQNCYLRRPGIRFFNAAGGLC